MTAKYEPEEAFHYMALGKWNAGFDAHGFAKVCLAYLSDKEKSEIYKNLSISESAQKELEACLRKIREDRVLVNLIDDQQGLKRFVAPVFKGESDEFAGALGVSLFGDCSNPALKERIAFAVKRAASAASNTIYVIFYNN
jgi:DNA-binding IclR family transcriptional regulator